ncbi:2-C-methyl-D-erythritol 4-phosphate cytidylyltransferase [Ferrimonas lipolytica]|uniref:2-C-methyl-D-erythritol 4-phosphate cytidylyltransferase n=1 Tax=Ferrimonas lipolytica TaxID=2724191 RepID=A0A6H1U944_9GAMM|nr:2-C-methyl-D-erythritol 4-phosphate cytidylyltransferase [Ferrimonas lipolytica]QIZ75561.1 2-C-methyl-D-erythritol 4-phosphate cytidylyltransferase [Ferrimonas lipolytica]
MAIDANTPIYAVVPAAGVGKRMGGTQPKQYLPLLGRAILSHTLGVLLDHPQVAKVVVALGAADGYFDDLPEATHPNLIKVVGGAERADSVRLALSQVPAEAWALVHDAARPCLTHGDIDQLLQQCGDQGAILAMPVRDTMKRANSDGNIDHTVERALLWHALTPQLFPASKLLRALNQHQLNPAITDEASAMELQGWQPTLVSGRPDNIKVTHPDDLRLAELFLAQRSAS